MLKIKRTTGILIMLGILFLGMGCNMQDGIVVEQNKVLEESPKPSSAAEPSSAPLPSEIPVEEMILDKKESRVPVKVKGIYITGPKAGSSGMEELIKLVDETKLNAMVIDIKNDAGEVTYKMDLDSVRQIESAVDYIPKIEEKIKELKEKGIYLIARIVAFKDPILAEKRPELALKTKKGKIFRDKSGLAWVNPYKKEVWNYLLEISKKAVELGFDEIQFDYVRFSTDSGMKDVDFEEAEVSKEEVIAKFSKKMRKELSKLGAYVSADVYGIIINSEIDQKIVGQNYKDMAENLDYICPMIYPSHYGDGSYGVKYPDLEPYTIIYEALMESKNVLGEDKDFAIVRPWLQDFNATWLPHHKTYDKEAVDAQIKAVEDAGYEEWILWNGSSRYTRLDAE